jgi:hypothetical protein
LHCEVFAHDASSGSGAWTHTESTQNSFEAILHSESPVQASPAFTGAEQRYVLVAVSNLQRPGVHSLASCPQTAPSASVAAQMPVPDL